MLLVQCALMHVFRKQLGCALTGAYALIRTNTVYGTTTSITYLRNFRFPISTDMALSVMCLNTVVVRDSTLVTLDMYINPV